MEVQQFLFLTTTPQSVGLRHVPPKAGLEKSNTAGTPAAHRMQNPMAEVHDDENETKKKD